MKRFRIAPGLRRALAFGLLFGCLYAALARSWGPGLSHWVIDVATVEPAAWIARNLCQVGGAVADGSHLRSPEASVNVLFGCEGSDVFLLLTAALLAAPAAWGQRLVGWLAGTALIFLLNQARVLALFLSLRAHSAWFGTLHGLVGPLAIVLVVGLYFLLWLRWIQPARRSLVPGMAGRADPA